MKSIFRRGLKNNYKIVLKRTSKQYLREKWVTKDWESVDNMIYAFRFKVLQLFGHVVQETVQGTLWYILDTEDKCHLCPLEINILLQTPKDDKWSPNFLCKQSMCIHFLLCNLWVIIKVIYKNIFKNIAFPVLTICLNEDREKKNTIQQHQFNFVPLSLEINDLYMQWRLLRKLWLYVTASLGTN